MKKINIKNSVFTLLLVAITSLLAACNDDGKTLVYGDEVGAPTAKAYIYSVYPFTSFSGSVHFDRLNKLTNVKTDVVKLPIHLSMNATKDIQVKMAVDTSLVSVYSKQQYLEYKLFPEECIQFVKNSVTIKAGARVSSDSIELALQNTDKLAIGRYVFPIAISSISDEGVGIQENMKSVFYKIIVTESYISVGRDPLPNATALDRTKFQFSSDSYYSTEKLVDGKYTSYWSASYSSYPLLIDLGSEEDIFGLSLAPGYSSYYGIYFVKGLKLEGSLDNDKFTTIDQCTMLSPKGTSTEPDIQYVQFKKTHLRYLRLSFDDSYGYSAGISEIQIYK
jgi:hypothetical protein